MPLWKSGNSGEHLGLTSPLPKALWGSRELASALGWDGAAGQHFPPWVSLKFCHSHICRRVSVDSIVGKGNSEVQASISYQLLSSRLWAPMLGLMALPFQL